MKPRYIATAIMFTIPLLCTAQVVSGEAFNNALLLMLTFLLPVLVLVMILLHAMAYGRQRNGRTVRRLTRLFVFLFAIHLIHAIFYFIEGKSLNLREAVEVALVYLVECALVYLMVRKRYRAE